MAALAIVGQYTSQRDWRCLDYRDRTAAFGQALEEKNHDVT